MVHQETISSIYSSFRKKNQIRIHIYLNKIVMNCSWINGFYVHMDGSKDREKVGSAVLTENDCQMMRIPDGSSVVTTEAKAII